MKPPSTAEQDWLEIPTGKTRDALIKWAWDWIYRQDGSTPLYLTAPQFDAMSAWFDKNVNRYGDLDPLPAGLGDIGPSLDEREQDEE